MKNIHNSILIVEMKIFIFGFNIEKIALELPKDEKERHEIGKLCL